MSELRKSAFAGVSQHVLFLKHLQHGSAKIGQVVRLAAADKVSVRDDGGIFVNTASIDQVIFDAGRAGDFDPAINIG